jgi:hypothetical protein
LITKVALAEINIFILTLPDEEGESELMKMMDASRAIPNTPSPNTLIDPNTPRIE